MDIGISIFPTDHSIDIAIFAEKVEEYGYESLWVPEHSIIPVETVTPWPGSSDGKIPKQYADIVDPFVALSRASVSTKTLKLGTGICLVPERNPLLLAKEVATLDHYSGGRFIFGIGAGWLREETEIMGGNFRRRWAQTRESIEAMKQLWTKVESEYHGEFYDFPKVYSFPSPVQRPHPPIYLGGHAKNVFNRIVAWGDGWIPNRITPQNLEKGRNKLMELADESGRNSTSINVTVYGQEPDVDLLKEFESIGADRVVIAMDTLDEKGVLKKLEEISQKIFSRFSSN